MSHFYGTVRGQAKTEASRRGSKSGGIVTFAASWSGAVSVRVYFDGATGRDCFEVSQERWHGAGIWEVIASGVLGQSVHSVKTSKPLNAA